MLEYVYYVAGDQDTATQSSKANEEDNDNRTDDESDIIVTGTRIPSTNTDAVSPVTTIGDVDFQLRPDIKIDDLNKRNNFGDTIAEAPVWAVGLVGVVGVLFLLGVLRIGNRGSILANLTRVLLLTAGSLLLGLVAVHAILNFGVP